jgi:hypothetical protein
LETLRPLAELANDLDLTPAALKRWIHQGVNLKDGSRLRLAATKFPGGWRISPPKLREFLDRLTADWLGDDPGAETRKAAVAAGLALGQAGF